MSTSHIYFKTSIKPTFRSPFSHLVKVLFPTELAHLSTLEVEVLSLGLRSICLHLALDGWVKGAQDSGGQESGIDAVVDSDGGDGDTYNYTLDFFFFFFVWGGGGGLRKYM